MMKKKVKICIPGKKTVLLPRCPIEYSEFLSYISKYFETSLADYQLVFKDSDGDLCEIVDQATFSGFFLEFEEKLSLNAIPLKGNELVLGSGPLESQRPCLYYFKRHSRFCYKFLLDTKEIVRSQLDAGINLKEYAAWVTLPSGEIFYCGGGYPISSSEVYLIYPDKNTYRKLADMIYSRHSHGIIYDKGFIFVFGGMENHLEHASVIRKCEKYCIAENRWEEITEIHNGLGDVSASVYGERILIFGKGSKCVSDYPFNRRLLNLGEDSGGCSLVHNHLLYTFQGSCLKIWDLDELSIKEQILMPSLKSWWSHSPPILYQNSIYFVWWEAPGWVCKFDTSTKEFKKLQNFS